MVERQFGPYGLVRQIAVGGMAEIYLARTKGIAGFEKYVALKMIHPNFASDDRFVTRLIDEAKIAVQLNHGNIAQTFDLGRVGDTFYITMEYVDGADLFQVLRRASEIGIEMPLDICAFVGKEIARALDHAHRKCDHAGRPLGIVHRDVSPQNVLLSHAGEVKLVDFGIAKAKTKSWKTAVGVIQGKYYYMSPEQAWGAEIDGRSDIFSAGIVLYEMLTGQMLYRHDDLRELLEMARSADIAPPSTLRRNIPAGLERIVMRALAKLPADRYQSGADLAADLERFLRACSPVACASKLASLVTKIVGDPAQVPTESSSTLRDGSAATHPISLHELIHDKAELRDENSVLSRMPPRRASSPRVPRKPSDTTRPYTEQRWPESDGDETEPDQANLEGLDTATSARDIMDDGSTNELVRGGDPTTVMAAAPAPQDEGDSDLGPIAAPEPRAPVPFEDRPTALRATTLPPPGAFSGGGGVALTLATPVPGKPMPLVPGVPLHLQPYANRDARAGLPNAVYQRATPFAVYSGDVRLFEPGAMRAQYTMPRRVNWPKLVIAAMLAIALTAGGVYYCARWASHLWSHSDRTLASEVALVPLR